MPLSYESRALAGTRSTGTAWVRGALQQVIGDIPDFRRDLRTPEEVPAEEAFPIIDRLTQAFRKQVDPKTHQTKFEIQPRGLVINGGLRGTIKSTGALAALYERTKHTVDEGIASLERIKPLDPQTDVVKFRSVLAIVKSNLEALVAEVQQEPREFQMDGLFTSLLGPPEGGLLGQLQGLAGLETPTVRQARHSARHKRDETQTRDFVRQTKDFEQYTQFRLFRNSVDSLKRFWEDTWKTGIGTGEFGVQFVHVGRRLQAMRETVAACRTDLDQVGLGDATRWTLQVKFPGTAEEPMSLESFLNLIDSEASRWDHMLTDGGTVAVPTVVEFVGGMKDLVAHATFDLDTGQMTDATAVSKERAAHKHQGRGAASASKNDATTTGSTSQHETAKLDELRATFDLRREWLETLLTAIDAELNEEETPETERSAM